MNSFYIITNYIKDKDLVWTKKIADYLRSQGKTCYLKKEPQESSAGSYTYTNPDEIPDDVDCILVLGGDGTLIQTARDVVNRQIPLFAVNLGTLGYLAEIDRQSVFPALDCLIRDEYEIERRMMLKGSIYRGEKLLTKDIALNDIVIAREAGLKLVHLKNYVDGEFLNTYRADGVILSTPTGSTGYSLSAGGPIVSPSASLILLTPLAAHALNARSVIFPAENVITVEIAPGKDGVPESAMAYFDGDTKVAMKTGDRIVMTRSSKDILIAKIHHSSFLETLRRKMSQV